MKELIEISWNVSEPEYRKDPALSYSTIASYEREGLNSVIGNNIKTPSLTYGSVVDCLVTDGMDCYNNRYIAIPLNCSASIANILIDMINNNVSLDNENGLLEILDKHHYCLNWKNETRIKKILSYTENYQLISNTIKENPNKEIIDIKVYEDAMNAYNVLHSSVNTQWYFKENTDTIKHYYQLKFKGNIENVDFRCMADLIIVDYDKKQIIPCDLKTTGHPEIKFWESFHKWYYFYQAKLYWNLIRQNLDKDEYFKNFELLPYKFIVVNKTTLNPMVYEFDKININEEYQYNGITYRNIITVAKELRNVLNERKKEMNKKQIIEALDKIHQGVTDLKTAVADIEEEKVPMFTDLKTLAKVVANTYKTSKPEYGSEYLYKNIKAMASSDKVKIILKWIDSCDIEAIKNFRKMPIQNQIITLNSAIDANKNEIIEILKNKFSN